VRKKIKLVPSTAVLTHARGEKRNTAFETFFSTVEGTYHMRRCLL
jgi:hypothetical protein